MTSRAHAFALDIIANAESGVGTQFAGTDILELARAYVGMGWRTIESAPRDVRAILGYDRTYASIMRVTWRLAPNDAAYTFDRYGTWHPSHWQPLPQPPSEGRDG